MASDESLIDRIKGALGMGDKAEDHGGHGVEPAREGRGDQPIDTERPADANRPGDEGFGDVSGATEATGWEGASGGVGATGALGGAGAAGPTGTTGPTEDVDEAGPRADPGQVRTEYEMGHESRPETRRARESSPGESPLDQEEESAPPARES